MQDSSSFVTFRACIDALTMIAVDMFILENVDLEDDESSNLGLILKALTDAGYKCKTYKLISSDFALPQRRIRLFILGYSKARQEGITFENIDKMLDVLQVKHLDPVVWLYFVLR